MRCSAAIFSSVAIIFVAGLSAAEPSIGAALPTDNSTPSLPPMIGKDGAPLALLRAFRGHTVLVNFWASWCVACRAELPSLERLAAKRGDLVVVAASVDADRDAGTKAFAGRYPHLRLAFSSLSAVQAYGALGMPYSVIFDKDGREVARVGRALEWDRPENAGKLPRGF